MVTLKLLQLMHGKGLVIRDESERALIYAVVMLKSQVEHLMLGDLVSRLFGGSSQRLVLQALGQTPPASCVELEEIRAMLNQMECGYMLRLCSASKTSV